MLEVVDGADADGAEVAHEDGVAPVGYDGGHEAVAGEQGGDAAEDEHEQAEGQEARAGDAGAAAAGRRERGPRHRHADVGEAREVQQHVDARVEVVVPPLRLGQKLPVPVERAPGHEARQQVARAQRAASAEDEELREEKGARVSRCHKGDKKARGGGARRRRHTPSEQGNRR